MDQAQSGELVKVARALERDLARRRKLLKKLRELDELVRQDRVWIAALSVKAAAGDVYSPLGNDEPLQ